LSVLKSVMFLADDVRWPH